MKLFSIYFILALLFFASVSSAEELNYKYRTYMRSEALIKVLAYDEKTKMYEVEDSNVSGQGPFFAEVANVARSLPGTSVDRLKKAPKSIINGKSYVPIKPLPYMNDLEFEITFLKRKPSTEKSKKPN